MIEKIKYYKDKNESYFISDRSDILNFCKLNNIDFSNKKVLEIGCGSGLTLKKISEMYNGVQITGVDLYAENIVSGVNVVKDSLENFILNTSIDEYDYILILDVLEHLVDPWSTLSTIKNNINSKTNLIISLPNVSDFIFINKLLFYNRFEYTSKGGIFDQTHLRFFTLKDMNNMFFQTGFKVLIQSPNYFYNNSLRKILHFVTFGFLNRFYTLQYFFILSKNDL